MAQSREGTDITHVMPYTTGIAQCAYIQPEILPRNFFSRFVNFAHTTHQRVITHIDMLSWSYTTQRYFSSPHAETDIDIFSKMTTSVHSG